MAGGTGILTFAEIKEGQLTPVARESIGVARKLADEKSWNVTTLLIGDSVGGFADDLIKFGSDKVITCDAPVLGKFLDESYCKIFAEVAEQEGSAVIIGGA